MSNHRIRLMTLSVAASASIGSMALVASLAGVAAAHGRAGEVRLASIAAAGPAKIGLRSSSLGKILVNGRGRTLYAFSRDRRGKDRCATTSGCTQVWPPATTHGRPIAGRGVKASLLGTLRLSGGVRQVTYAGHPLYTYSLDGSPAQTDYVGQAQFHGVWRAVSASGRTMG